MARGSEFDHEDYGFFDTPEKSEENVCIGGIMSFDLPIAFIAQAGE